MVNRTNHERLRGFFSINPCVTDRMRLKKIEKQQLEVVQRELCGSERDCCGSLYWNKTCKSTLS